MFTVKLLTRSGDFVTHALLPDIEPAPEGIQWGSRFFFRNEAGEYREGLLYYVFSESIVAGKGSLEE